MCGVWRESVMPISSKTRVAFLSFGGDMGASMLQRNRPCIWLAESALRSPRQPMNSPRRRRAQRWSSTRMCAPAEAPRREIDPRGFVLPRPGDVVLFPGRWADEDCAGLVETVRPRATAQTGGAAAPDAGSVVDVVEMRGVGHEMFEATRRRRWFDVAEIRIAADAQYIPGRDAYRIPSARSGYAEVAPMDAAAKLRADAEYAELKKGMRQTTALAGVMGTAVAAALVPGTDAAIGFALGSAASLLYLVMLQVSVDVVGRTGPEGGLSRFLSSVLGLRFAVPALPFVIQGALKNTHGVSAADLGGASSFIGAWLGCLSREQAAATVIGLLTYKVPVLRQTGAEAVDSLAEMPLNTGTTGMIGTAAGLVARAIKRRSTAQEIGDASSLDATTSSADNVKPLLFVFAGPSGVGKSTLVDRLFAEFPDDYGFCVSHTTRAPRVDEINGVDYNFVDRNAFERMIVDGKFVEHAEVHGNLYGTSFDAISRVLESGRFCVLDLDVQGVRALSQRADQPWRTRYVWIAPPSLDALRERLEERATESPESLSRRMDTATREIAFAATSNVFDRTIINSDFGTAYTELVDFVEREKAEIS